MIIEPIGFFHSQFVYPQQTPRQGVMTNKPAWINLCGGQNFEAALDDIAGVERIWLIWGFDRVHSWHPHVRPPVGGLQRKIGVFATRSPHRPNPLGITAVPLLAVENLKLIIGSADLLDGTPIYDIKPYIPVADSFPESRVKWLDDIKFKMPSLVITDAAAERIAAIIEFGGPDLAEVAKVQLVTREINPRVQRITSFDVDYMQLAFRTWRIIFRYTSECVEVVNICSGYTSDELCQNADDTYKDKNIHRKFRTLFPI